MSELKFSSRSCFSLIIFLTVLTNVINVTIVNGATTEKVQVKTSRPRIAENSTKLEEKKLENDANNNNSSGNGSNNNNNEDEAAGRKNFLSLSADCLKNGSFFLNLQTSEPFHGWLYARDHQVSN